jgi:hypothetical protein
MTSDRIEHLVRALFDYFRCEHPANVSYEFFSAGEFGAYMNRYGYTDTKAEGAVGGSTDFVGFQLCEKHPITGLMSFEQGNVTYGRQQCLPLFNFLLL